jgi:RsiW-degrading membrane proteinase PrsW (M82 family)
MGDLHITLLGLAVGVLPVLAFLAALIAFESYKLVQLPTLLGVLALGAAVAVACYFVNGALIDALQWTPRTYARSAGPLVEELAKGLLLVLLIRANRVGFLVDAAIIGFALGAGFAVVENVVYQALVPDAGLGTWIVRGFGTALMHGGVAAIFAMMGLALRDRANSSAPWVFLPGFAIAAALHVGYNQLVAAPRLATLAVLLVLPPLMFLVFRRSEAAVGEWLGRGFDRDAEIIGLIDGGTLAETPVGRYLQTLRDRFDGPVAMDLLCYLRLHTELAMRAKGVLMMREAGFDAPLDAETRAKLVELRFLASSIGRTGLLALRPLVAASRRDLWQLGMLRA